MKKHKLSLFLAVLLCPFFLQGQSIFVNEIHYDNSGADSNEGIEIAGPAGTDLTGWSIILYNGNGGATYNTVNLGGVIPNLQGNTGTLFFPISGLQNGAPDGFALVDNNNTVIQFLSYEGSFTAVGGLADGLISDDIGVAETGSTTVGFSLQLTGSGSVYTDFTWSGPIANTNDAVNTGQTFTGGVLPNPMINEFVANHTGTDSDEFVEIIGQADSDYSEFWLLEIEGDGTSAGTIDEVIQIGTTDGNGYWSSGFLSNAFENGTISLLLVKNFTGTLGDDLDTNNDGVLDVMPFDEIVNSIGVKDGDLTDVNYSTVTLEQGFDGSSFTVGGASRIPNGVNNDMVSDWVRNDFDGSGLPSFPGVVADAGEAINTPLAENAVTAGPSATVIINEIDADTPGTDMLEFIELYDGGIGNTALDGLVIVLYNGSNDQSYNAIDLDGQSTNGNGYFVIGNSGVANVDLIISNNGLQNGADAVALYQDDAASFPNGTAVTITNLIDAIVYDTNDGDDAGLLVLLNVGQDQVNEGGNGDKDNESLQRLPNGSGGLRNTSSYAPALPTPGTANSNSGPIAQVIINEIDADTPGSDMLEFIELFDGGAGNTALDGLVVVLYNGSNNQSYNAYDLDGFSTNAEGYFVLGNAGVANVNLVINDNSLQNGADAVALYQGDAVNFPNGTAISFDNLQDAVVYDTNDSDDLELLPLLNAGEPQLNEDANGNKDNESLQRIPNGSGGQRNTSSYIAASPSPGTENGQVVGPTEPISIADARASAIGTNVTIRGVLTASDQFGGPAYLQDSTGGIAVFDATVHGDMIFAIGDSLEITGARSAFNMQVQIGPVSSVQNFGPANNPILPAIVTLDQLSNFPGQLVTISNPTFPAPGDLLFGNSNYQIADVSGTGELRIDNDVASIVGLAQPDSCSSITGVVGRFQDIFQLLPRQQSDMPCAEPFEPSGDDLSIPKEETFDITTWNIEWFGDENNSPAAGDPNADSIQKDSVKSIIELLQSDVIAVQEISDTTLFSQMVNELPGYDFILSDFVSRPNDPGVKQRIGFIYKTATVNPIETRPLLATIHPLYNGGDASALVGYPDATDRFYASGRLPFLMVADVTINGTSKQLHIVNIHARANSGNDAQLRYDLRKYDVEVLKDSLDAQFSNTNLLLLGDFNDDLDETVADIPSTVSSYEVYTNDTANYNAPTLSLSNDGFRSFVFRENMIDHILNISALNNDFVVGSARVGYEFYDNDYSSTASDHLPVSARYQFEIIVENNECVGGEIIAFNQGRRKNGWKVSTLRSNPNKALGAPLENFFLNFVSLGFGGDITIKLNNEIADIPGNDFKVFETTAGNINIPCHFYPESAEVFASSDGINFVSLGTTCLDGKFDLANGNLNKASYIKVVDISDKSKFLPWADGYDLDGIMCINENSQARTLSTAEEENLVPNEDIPFTANAYPNPFNENLNLQLSLSDESQVTMQLFNRVGQLVYNNTIQLQAGNHGIDLPLSAIPDGLYILKLANGNRSLNQTLKIVKE